MCSRYYNKRYEKALKMLENDEFGSIEEIVKYCKEQVEKNYNSLCDYEIIVDKLIEKWEDTYILPF